MIDAEAIKVILSVDVKTQQLVCLDSGLYSQVNDTLHEAGCTKWHNYREGGICPHGIPVRQMVQGQFD